MRKQIITAILSACTLCTNSTSAATNPQHPSRKQLSKQFAVGIWHDYKNFYSLKSMSIFGLSLIAAGISANTDLDQNIADGYQKNIRSKFTNSVSNAIMWQGTNWPVYVGYTTLTVTGILFKQSIRHGFFGWGARNLRAVLVGAPVVLAGQAILGANRPINGPNVSSWQPFKSDHGISGHAFLGAVPFMTAATMTNNIWLKSGLYTLSSLTGIARINKNMHYFSQVLLGWTVAWLATHSVAKSVDNAMPTIAPVIAPGTSGIALNWRF